MKIVAPIKIIDGPKHADLSEDRCENLMDMRSKWNVSFQLEGLSGPSCIAAEVVRRVAPEEKLFSSILEERACRPDFLFDLTWWSDFIAKLSQIKYSDVKPDFTVWCLGGGAHCWHTGCDDIVVFVEYDAIEQCGYALVATDSSNLQCLAELFQHPLQAFYIEESDWRTLCRKW